jgi:hypothetical protein
MPRQFLNGTVLKLKGYQQCSPLFPFLHSKSKLP